MPSVWQGWVVFAVYVGLLIAVEVTFRPDTRLGMLVGSASVLTGVFVAVCWWKGEPPRWRWGK